MKLTKRKIVIFTFVLAYLFPLLASAQLTTCSGPDCDFNSLISLIRKIIDFMIFALAAPIATIAFAYSGFLYLTSGASPSNREKAKSIFWNVLWGFVIALSAWLIVNAILVGLGAKTNWLKGVISSENEDTGACTIIVKPWSGADPYIKNFSGSSDQNAWQNTKPELRQAFESIQKKYPNVELVSTWRPQEYQDHIQSIWDSVRFIKGESVNVPSGYGDCPNPGDIYKAPQGWDKCGEDFKKYIDIEARRHDSYGPTRPACNSDHIQGFAIDIKVPGTALRDLVEFAESLPEDIRLCHYIASDSPHFGLKKYLPVGTKCTQGV